MQVVLPVTLVTMSTDAPLSRRDRLRAQTLEEIRAHAWAQVDAGGAHSLSLNAIAKAMGMSGPALYRYFASRDELIGALVIEGYGDLVQAIADAAASAAARKSPARRVAAVAEGYRAWALAHPRRYVMLFDPRPDDVVDSDEAIATISGGMLPLLEALGELAPGAPDAAGRDKLDQQLRRWARVRDIPADAPVAVLRAGVLTWTQLHGIVSLEIAGALPAMGLDGALLVEAALGST
jgi:AcrR family transcriptional regulator